MRTAILGAALVVAAAAYPQQPPSKGTTAPRAAPRADLLGQVVSADPAARTVTLKDVRRRDAAHSGWTAADPGGDTLTLSVAAAAGDLGAYRPGDWVELGCGAAPAATAGRRAAATPAPVATGTGAPPGTGTTGVGTTGTGISGTGTPAPGATVAETAAWVRAHCAVVMRLAAGKVPAPSR
jgi:hypothetical protein